MQVRASDGSLSDGQTFTVKVTDVDEVINRTSGDDNFTALPGTERINAGTGHRHRQLRLPPR